MDSNRNTMMGMPDDNADGTGTGHIWLRYATQFTVDERSYTIDMGIPVPLGADEETRERLLREAEAGMDQLSQHVERRVARLQQNAATLPGMRTLPTQKSTAAPSHAPMPSATPVPASRPPSATSIPVTPKPASTTSTPVPVSRSASQGTAPSAVPAASAPIRETPTGQIPDVQSSQSRQPAQAAQSTPVTPPTQKKPVTVPPTRPNIGASMPPSPGLPGGTLQLPQFLQYIKEMGLDARQAMDLLKVKSLSGLNLRDALEQLQHIVMKEGMTTPMPTSTPTQSQAPQPQPPAQTQTQTPRPKMGESGAGSNPGSGKQAASNSAPASTGASSTSSNSTRPASAPGPASTPVSSASSPMPSAPRISGSGKSSAGSEPKPVVIQEERAPYRGFDEEEDETELDDFEVGIDEEEEVGATTGVSLSAGNRRTAEDIVERLREARGSSVVSAQRVIVLHNVIGDQVQPEQLQALIRGIWGATSERKLKNEQAEALISWGKQDTFDTEAEMVLALFEEDADARSDR